MATVAGPPAIGAAEGGAVVIVDARVLWAEPVLEDGGLVYGLQVESVLHGFAPGSVLAIRVQEGTDRTAPTRRLLEPRAHRLVRVELRDGNDGLYELVSAHAIHGEANEDGWVNAPGGIAVEPEDREDLPPPGGFVPRRVRSAAEDTSPEQDVVEIVNQERWNNGMLPPLKRVTELDNSSEGHSSSMASRNFFAHCDLDTGKSPWVRMNEAGYFWNAAAENIAAGESSPAAVMSSWMNSPNHRANILSSNLREIGVGYYFQSADQSNIRRDLNSDCTADSFNHGPYHSYWTQNFGSRGSVYPVIINREASSTTSQTVTLYVYGAGFATQMRFSNNGSTYSAWEPYGSQKSWTLSAGGGDKTVWAQLNSNPIHTATDTIYLSAPCPATTLQNTTLDGSPSTYQNCEIIAGPSVPVTGDTTFLANLVRLRSGFSVNAGVEFKVGQQP
ncbi:MAG TPA: CAP domain-containing protein [Thermoanaerobaculia bacterium]|nr:CAP domain-containing protein [Thermoanaerobaculia bacterium]